MAFTEQRTPISIFTPNSIPGPQDLFRAMRKWVKRNQRRREIEALLKQEDWVLCDMGITRGDVHEALAGKSDPSLTLRAMAARRRYWKRQYNRI